MKYSTSADGYDISVHGIGMNHIDYKIKIRGNYDQIDYTDKKCTMLYGNEIEVRTFFENKNNNLSCIDFVKKII
jgi:hypothetical protein